MVRCGVSTWDRGEAGFTRSWGIWLTIGARHTYSGGTLTCDDTETRHRISRLRAYMRRGVLDGEEFVCRHWRECESSIPAGCTFTEGQLSHVGGHYDLAMNGKPLRVVVVGQEVGARGRPRTTLEERQHIVHHGSGLNRRFDADGVHQRRNPQLRGTTLALRTIFSRPGLAHETEFLDVGGQRVHMFDCFALVNRLLCSSHMIGTSKSKATPTMFSNCEDHFATTMEILEPTIAVIQGVSVWRQCKRTFEPSRQISKQLIECHLQGRSVLVCAFTHPSAWGEHRWDTPGSPYFTQVVEPTLSRAMSRL